MNDWMRRFEGVVPLGIIGVVALAACSNPGNLPGDIPVTFPDGIGTDGVNLDVGEDTGPDTVQCNTNADCAEDSPGPCVVGLCDQVTKTCSFGNLKDYLPCDDGDACTREDHCESGACVGDPEDCSDGDVCTDDGCDPASGCVWSANSEPCDDGNGCTLDDTCAAGACVGTPDASCQCVTTEDCAQFEDDNVCNGSLVCDEGSCVVDTATVVTCDDSETPACWATTCDPATGACNTAPLAEGPCDDGNACTLGDTCEAGACVPGAFVCPCETAEECAPYDDGEPCNGVLGCVDGLCAPEPGSVPDCTDLGGPCAAGVCDPATGVCQAVPVANGTACSDGDACTQADSCTDGACVSGAPVVCDDADPCTDDSCDETGACAFAPNAATCDDGDDCTEDDVCNAGVCAGTYVPFCGEPFCGDGNCDVGFNGEHCANCATDCGACEGECCEAHGGTGCEDPALTECVCAADWICCAAIWDATCVFKAESECGACVVEPGCGDGTCDPGEDCASCEADCGACPPPKGPCCQASGTPGCEDESVESCVCGLIPGCCTTAWTTDCAAIADGSCTDCPAVCGDGVCEDGEDCASCADDCGACPVCGDGDCEVSETCASCAVDCGGCLGGGDCCEPNGSPGCNDAAIATCVCAEDDFCCTTVWDALCVSDAVGCGADCEAACGNGVCGAGETCDNCAADCGECETCGNGTCDPSEDCANCPEDCGGCESCGDGTCGAGESCGSCPDDCGVCAPTCGDGACEVLEGCGSCPADCGACACTADGFEPNDSQGAATALAFGPAEAADTCGSVDWFSFTLAAGQTAYVVVSFSGGGGGDIDASVHDPSGKLMALETGDGDVIPMLVTASVGGQHAVRIWGETPDTVNDYTVQVTLF